MLTLEPSRIKACANSIPIAPPPIIIRWEGKSVREKIVSFVKYGNLERPDIFGLNGFVPVALTAYV